jgi:hypothetical protein
MSFDPGETLGDIPLAAVVRHGLGKAIIFGDTSTFQRSAIYNTHELVSSIFTYLAAPGVPETPTVIRLAGVVLLLAGVAGLLAEGPTALKGAVCAAVLGVIVLTGAAAISGVDSVRLTPEAGTAWIDLAHGNRVDLHTGEENGITGLVDHFWRHGFLPLGMKQFEASSLGTAEVFATVAPAFPYSRRERAALRGYVEDGGLLIVASGYEERRGSQGLLAEFGYEIGSTPIGAAHVARAHLGRGLQIVMHESWPVLRPESGVQVWVSAWDYPLVTFERIGDGGLIVIGDSFFLCDVSQESSERFVEPNIEFLRAAIDTARAQIAPEGRS